MGFYSQSCSYCEKSIISRHASVELNDWMTQAVVLTRGGSILRGTYDGYGRIHEPNGVEHDYAIGLEGNEVYHAACWVEAGKPTEWTHESKNAPDQGFFFDDDEMAFSTPAEAKAGKPIPSMFTRMTTEEGDP